MKTRRKTQRGRGLEAPTADWHTPPFVLVCGLVGGGGLRLQDVLSALGVRFRAGSHEGLFVDDELGPDDGEGMTEDNGEEDEEEEEEDNGHDNEEQVDGDEGDEQLRGGEGDQPEALEDRRPLFCACLGSRPCLGGGRSERRVTGWVPRSFACGDGHGPRPAR